MISYLFRDKSLIPGMDSPLSTMGIGSTVPTSSVALRRLKAQMYLPVDLLFIRGMRRGCISGRYVPGAHASRSFSLSQNLLPGAPHLASMLWSVSNREIPFCTMASTSLEALLLDVMKRQVDDDCWSDDLFIPFHGLCSMPISLFVKVGRGAVACATTGTEIKAEIDVILGCRTADDTNALVVDLNANAVCCFAKAAAIIVTHDIFILQLHKS
jgi:hypothetical protein